MREHCETDSDIAKETEVIKRICGTKLKYYKLSEALYFVDYCVADTIGKIKAFIEIKCRSKLKDIMILSLGKYMRGRQLAEIAKVPFCICFAIDGKLYWRKFQVGDPHPEVRIMGRVDRGDPLDLEPCICIKKEELT